MSQGYEFSDEFINVFVDNQMTPEEKARVYVHAASDEAFNRRVCELRKIRDLIRLAYRELPKSGQKRVISSVKAAGHWDRYKK
jgi:hypothetical protein